MQQLPSKRSYPFEDNPSLLINSTSLSGTADVPILNLKLDSKKLKKKINSLLELGFNNRDINYFISLIKDDDKKKEILAKLSLPLSIENINKLKAKGFEIPSIKEMIGRASHFERLELMGKDVFLAAIDKLLGLGLTHGFISHLVVRKLSITNNIIEKLVEDDNYSKLKYILKNLEKQKISLQAKLTKKGNLFDHLNELYQSYLSLSSPNLAEDQISMVVSSDSSQSQVLIDNSSIQTEGLSAVNEGSISVPDLQQVSKSGDTNLSPEVRSGWDNSRDGQVSNEAQTFFNPLPAAPINQDFNQPQSQVQLSKPESSFDIEIHSLPPMTHGDIEGFVNTCDSDNDQAQSSLEGHDQSDFSDCSDEFCELTPLPISPSISYASDSEILTQGDHQSPAPHTESMNAFLIPIPNSSTLSRDSHDGQVISRGEDEINRDAPELCEEDNLEFHKLIKNDQHYQAKFEKLQGYGFTVKLLITLSGSKSNDTHKDFLDKLSAPKVIDSFEKLRQKGFEDENISSMAIKGPNCASNFIRLAQDDFLTAVDKLTKLGFENRNLSYLIHRKGQSAVDDIIKLAQDENISKINELIAKNVTINNICSNLQKPNFGVLENFHNYFAALITSIEGEGGSLDVSARTSYCSLILLTSGSLGGDVGLGATQNQFNSAGEMSSVHTAAAVRQPSLSPMAVNSAKKRGIGNKFRVNFRG